MADTLVQIERIAGLSQTFQWDMDRKGAIGNGGFSFVPFNGTFDEVPVVVAFIENTGSPLCRLRNISKTGFEVQQSGGGPSAVHYFACTPGVWLVNGFLVQTAELATSLNSANAGWVNWFRPFKRTPALFACAMVGVVDPGNQKPGIIYTGTPSTADPDRFGTKGLGIHMNNASGNAVTIIGVEPTGPGVIGTNPLSGGSGSFKAGHKFEAGYFRTPAALGSITFASPFAAAPALVFTTSGFDGYQNSGENIGGYRITPITTRFDYEVSSAPIGCQWLAMDKGFGSTAARRLV